jgi:hypothetical protein
MKQKQSDALTGLKGLGPVSAGWLVDVGIRTPAELRAVGAVEAYGRVSFRWGRAATANLLYALHAAIEDKHWTEVTPAEKARLRKAAGLSVAERRRSS